LAGYYKALAENYAQSFARRTMKAALFTPKMVCKLVTLFAFVGAIASILPAPRFTAEAQGLKNGIAVNPDVEVWTMFQQNSDLK
jgi:hypothetical protein